MKKAYGGEEERSHYYECIAKSFFSHRGAPFVLSSQEFELINTWEKTGIPLSVVLEGIKKAYEERGKRKRKAKMFSLSFCDRFVMEGFSLYKEKRVGQKSARSKKGPKEQRVLSEVKKFLKEIPSRVEYLRIPYSQVQKKLSQGKMDEEDLERTEEAIELLLIQNATSEEKEAAKKETLQRLMTNSREEFEKVFTVILTKHLRTKYKIPHISPFYY